MNWAIAIYIFGTCIAAWTGYSFIAMTQQRQPRLADSLNVFLMVIGMFLLNSTIDKAPYWYFFAITFYMATLHYVVYYNFQRLLNEVLPWELNFREWQWTMWGFTPYLVVAAVAGWLTLQGHLNETGQLIVAGAIITQPVSWVLIFRRFWKYTVSKTEAIQSAGEAS